MKYDPQRHHRRSIRLKGYDDAWPGACFVTICTQGRAYMFGTIMDGEMRLNEAGRMVERWWLELNNKFPNVRTDAYVVMPNHFHGIVMIVDARDVGADPRVRPDDGDAHTGGTHTGGTHTGVPLHHPDVWGGHIQSAHTQVRPYIIPIYGGYVQYLWNML